jgi:hypothetical protein
MASAMMERAELPVHKKSTLHEFGFARLSKAVSASLRTF